MKRLFASVALGLVAMVAFSAAGITLSGSTPSHAASLAPTSNGGCIHPVIPTPTPTPVYVAPPKGTSYAVKPGEALLPGTVIKCHKKPPAGKVPGVHLCGALFNGTGAIYSVITCAKLQLLVTLPCATETAFSQSITGTDLHIVVPGAKIFKFDPSTGQSYLVSAVTGSGGEYTFVFGSCKAIPILPRTGAGGSPASPFAPGFPWLPFGVGVATLSAGALLTLRGKQLRA